MKYFFITLLGILIVPSCVVSALLSKNKSPEYYYQQGLIETKNTNSYVAIKDFTRAIKMKPDYRDAYNERANTYLSLDSIDSAIRDYDSLLIIRPINQQQMAKLYYLKGNALYLKSADSSACTCWRRARDLNDNDSWNKIRKFCK